MAIAVSPGSRPQYGADAYIVADIAVDMLLQKLKPDSDYKWMIDALTCDGGELSDFKKRAETIIAWNRAGIVDRARQLVAQGRRGKSEALRLLAKEVAIVYPARRYVPPMEEKESRSPIGCVAVLLFYLFLFSPLVVGIVRRLAHAPH